MSGAEPRQRREEPPATVEEALERARLHGQTAAAELAAALSALLDAGALMASGKVASETAAGPLHAGLAEIRRMIEPERIRDGESLLRVVAESLDAEISRWEQRSQEEPEGRAVLRAFLGVRELLWELGVRSGAPGPEPSSGAEAPATPDPVEAPARRAVGDA